MSGTRLSLGMTEGAFLSEVWQQRPLLIRGAIAAFVAPLDEDALWRLAEDPEVESRLVREHGRTPWELELGPFEAALRTDMPERDWTLLVQDVDKHIASVARLLELFAFVPAWRIDDVMISLAAPGGSVGPHVDDYDVFLLQGTGRRQWQIGCRDAPMALVDGLDLRILRQFDATETWTLDPGDMLYLPARIPHFGRAVDRCTTYSIGARAPSQAELISRFADAMLEALPGSAPFRDAPLAVDAPPGRLDMTAIARLNDLIRSGLAVDGDGLERFLGRYLTESKSEHVSAEGTPTDPATLVRSLNAGHTVRPSHRVRWLHTEHDDRALLFFDGQVRQLDVELTPLASLLTARRAFTHRDLGSLVEDDRALGLLADLLEKGLLFLE